MTRPAPLISRLRELRVRARPPGLGGPSKARLTAGSVTLPCVLGPAGIVRRKREGDGATPAGAFAIVGGRFRSDRLPRPRSATLLRRSRTSEGWCDDPDRGCYNRPVTLPCKASHERLWRDDRLYDMLLVLDYNLSRRRRNAGSAIFLHVMSPGGTPTAGCIALDPTHLRRLLPRLARACTVHVG